ncbi:unnamed protein product [Mycena citricolor]|uniref:Uncharacterized protein n=1 Tax=Mycena citricolor TaxID=2018698 RepID=A0AAD2K0A6_9AGAR|nr:unnamed protein product [Mycena citricolor]
MASIPNLSAHQHHTEALPEHHVHKDSDPLPGARGAAPAVDYSPETMERLPSSVWQDADPTKPTRELSEIGTSRPTATTTTRDSEPHSGRDAFSEKRPDSTDLRDSSTAAAGPTTTHDHHHDSGIHDHASKPSAADKMIGTAQKLVGKVTKKPEMEEKGQIRASEGKAAAASIH